MTRVAASVLLVSLTLVGCTAGSDESSSAPDLGVVDSGGGLPAVGELPPEPATEEDSDGDGDRSIVSTGSLRITVDDPIAAASETVRIVEAAGGRVDERMESPGAEAADDVGRGTDQMVTSGTDPSASLLVRIPSGRLTATLDEIEELGEVESVSLTQTDVTTTVRDVDARIAALRTSVDRLTALLAGATSTADLIEIENALSSRQAELEGLEAQQRSLADQVDLATVSIAFGSPASAPVDEPLDFLGGLRTGAEALLAFLGAAAVALGVALPWLGALALIAIPLVLTLRRRRSPPASPTGRGDAE